MLILGLFTMFYYANTLKIIEFLHLFCFNLIAHVDIGLHRLIITVTCPFHDNLWWDAHGQRITNECPSSSVRTDQLVLRTYNIYTIITLVIGLPDLFINLSLFTK